MKHAIIMANYRKETTHNFKEGEYIMKITSKNTVANYIVDEVISDQKIRIRLIMSDDSRSNSCETISGLDLTMYLSNKIANKILKDK
jgi:hypothetical protein